MNVQRIRNFPKEPYGSLARALLYLAITMVCAFAATLVPGVDLHVPAIESCRWWIGGSGMLAGGLSEVLHRRGRRV